MGKVYPFPTKKKADTYTRPNYSSQTGLIRELMDTLVLTYEDKIEELKKYRQQIENLDGKSFKSPREVSKEVKALKQLFEDFGITCNYFKFYTKHNQEILYYTQSSSVYLIKNQKMNDARKMAVGEFIGEFEGYHFNLCIDAEVLRIFDNQINRLNITIETLKNTRV